jgi:hypothetical protein
MHRTAYILRVRGRALHGDSVDREADAEVTDVGHECAGLSTIDRYRDVQPIKRAQEAVKEPEPSPLEAGLEHWGVQRRIRRLGLPFSSLLVSIQKFLDSRVHAFKVPRPANRADLLAKACGQIVERLIERGNGRVGCREIDGIRSPTPTVPPQDDSVRQARAASWQLRLLDRLARCELRPISSRRQQQVGPSASLR